MKKTCLAAMLGAALLFAGMAEAKEWYEGGTLHRATAAQWLAGSERDRVATASDWVCATGDQATVKKLFRDEPQTLRAVAEATAQCVTQTLDGGAGGNMPAREAAVLCLALFKGQGRGLGWLLAR